MADLKALLLNGADEAVSVNQRALVYVESSPTSYGVLTLCDATGRRS